MDNNLYFATKDNHGTVIECKPNYQMVFNDGKDEVATLDWNDGVLKFSGKMAKSAEVFLTYFKPFLDEYIESRLQEKR